MTSEQYSKFILAVMKILELPPANDRPILLNGFVHCYNIKWHSYSFPFDDNIVDTWNSVD